MIYTKDGLLLLLDKAIKIAEIRIEVIKISNDLKKQSKLTFLKDAISTLNGHKNWLSKNFEPGCGGLLGLSKAFGEYDEAIGIELMDIANQIDDYYSKTE